MKEEKEVIHLKDGTTKTKQTRKYTQEDGFIEDDYFLMEDKGVNHKGYQTQKTTMTNAPRGVCAFIKSFCLFFQEQGIFITYSSSGVWNYFCFIKYIYIIENRKNDEREKEFVKKPQYRKEDRQVVDDFKKEIKEETKSTFSKVFSKENGKQFKKIFLLFYTIIVLLMTVLLGVFISWLPASFILGLLIFVGILYYLFINYLF